jgi:hypothetical protein
VEQNKGLKPRAEPLGLQPPLQSSKELVSECGRCLSKVVLRTQSKLNPDSDLCLHSHLFIFCFEIGSHYVAGLNLKIFRASAY